MQKAAEKLAREEPPSVTGKTILPPGAGRHDYVSLAIYYWPDPTKPGGKPYVVHDGRVNPERLQEDRYDAARLDRLCYAVNTLALAYALTGDDAHAAAAARYLRAWFLDPATRMSPSLTFAQGVPGKEDGRPSGIIDTFTFILLTDSVRLLESSPAWTAAEAEGVRGWFSAYLDWLLTSRAGQTEAKATNNHGVWYDAQVAAFALFAGREETAASVVREALTKRVEAQIQPDGSMPRELARTRSQHYTAFTLEAFTTLARVGDVTGVNLWDHAAPDGRGLRQAYRYLLPYLLGRKVWEHEALVVEQEHGFARYLALAGRHYREPDFFAAARVALGDERGRERLAAAALPPAGTDDAMAK